MSIGAVRYSCSRCQVSVGRIDGEATSLPETWSRLDGLDYCLSCSRARAGEAAVDSASPTISREDLVKLRRTALIEFEIGRAPAAPDRAVARACRTSNAAVAAVRGRLDQAVASAPGAAVGHSA